MNWSIKLQKRESANTGHRKLQTLFMVNNSHYQLIFRNNKKGNMRLKKVFIYTAIIKKQIREEKENALVWSFFITANDIN